MKSNNDIDDELLGRWLAGDLSDEERISFEASDAYKSYEVIGRYSNELETPKFNSDEVYGQIDVELAKKKNRVIKISFYKKLAVAASIIVLIGIGAIYMFSSNPVEDTTILTAQGETKNIILPDNSEVDLNVSSSISYNEENWNETRLIELEGEAFFKVEKGKRFIVKTDQGDVEVLGTSFNIRNRDNFTEVVCYSGRVKVTSPLNSSVVLEKNDATRIVDNIFYNGNVSHDLESPAWQSGFSQFDNIPLQTVIDELENQYAIRVDCKVDISNRMYVGYVPHDNLSQALELVFAPMQLKYTEVNEKLFVVE